MEARERSRREKKEKKEKKNKKNKKGSRRQSRKTEAACVASAGCNNLLTVYQISTAPSEVAPGTMQSLWLDSRPLHGRRQGGSGERLPQERLMCTLGGSLREKQKRRG